VRPTTTHESTLRPIRLRWKGYTEKDLDTLRGTARELAKNDDYDGAEAKYDELLEAAKYLLPAAGEAASGIAYEVAIFYAHSDNMTKADEVIDDLSAQFTQRWGFSHEKTVNHYSTIASLLTVWNRHDDAVNILKWMMDDFSTSVMGSRAGAKTKPAQSPHSGASPSVNLDSPLLRSSMPFVANSNKETSSSSALAVLQARLNSSRTVVVDDDESADQLVLDLLHRMEANPERNGTDIIRARCLLVDFYNKVGLPEESKLALQAAKHSIQSLCQLECRMPIEFFDVSIGLAEILLSDGDATNGEQLLERIETRFVQAYGESHTDTISLLIRIGKMYQRLKRWEDAEPRFEQAYAACITELGYDSTVTKNLERCLEKKHYSSSLELDDETKVCPIIIL
jgi:tetratricopeptide (TPR) repeat protein